MTFSKSGVSMSVGAGGTRITRGPRGTHVGFSKGGFYYRTRVDAPRRGKTVAQPLPKQAESAETRVPVSAPSQSNSSLDPPVEIFGEATSADAVVRAINKRVKRRNYALPIALAISGGLFAASLPLPIVVAIGVVSTVLLAFQQQRAKYSSLIYGTEEETAQRLEALHKAIAGLRTADSVWSVREVSRENGLAARPATLSRIKLGDPVPLPKYLRANVTPAALQLTNATLYLFPDRIFIWHKGQFAAIEYRDVQLQFRRVTFLEREKQPPDAAVEGRMRRSLSDASTIPILYYGLVEIDAGPTLKAQLMTSRVESGEEFVARLRTIVGRDITEEQQGTTLYTHYDPARVPLFYNLNDHALEKFRAIQKAFEIILECDYVWRYEGEERTDDWKRNAGAGTLVTRSRISPSLVESDSGFESNAVFGFALGNSTLFVFPDAFVLRTGQGYRGLGSTLHVSFTTSNFREEEASPTDAEVVGTTWRYVNKSGGPDRRFNNNQRIPIYRYGHVEIVCDSWRVHLCLSRSNAAAEFASTLRSALSGLDGQSTSKDHSEGTPPPRPNQSIDAASALARLGLQPGASLEDASHAYRILAAQNHPDKVAHMAPEFRELAERRMRELNAAYEQIRAHYGES